MYTAKVELKVTKSGANVARNPPSSVSPTVARTPFSVRSPPITVVQDRAAPVNVTRTTTGHSSRAPPSAGHSSVSDSPFAVRPAWSGGTVSLGPRRAAAAVETRVSRTVVELSPEENNAGKVTLAPRSFTARDFDAASGGGWKGSKELHYGSGGKPKMADQKFIDEMLEAHNKYRKEHKVEPLVINKALNALAQKWADYLAAHDLFKHSDCDFKGERVGENIAMQWSSSPSSYTGGDATNNWYSEIEKHTTFGASTSPSGTGHFTQVVWKGSRELGVGRAVTKDNKVLVVANYRPAGNMVGDYAANVLSPKSGKITLPPKPARESNNAGSWAPVESEGGEKRTTETETITEGSGKNKVTRIITTECITKANGQKEVRTSERVIRGADSKDHASNLGNRMGGLSLHDWNSDPFQSGLTYQSTGNNSFPAQRVASHSASKTIFTGKTTTSPTPSTASEVRSASSRAAAPGGHLAVAAASGSRAGQPLKMSDFHQSCLQAHNRKRALHGACSLVLADDLSRHAQKWAEKLASENRFEHSNCIVNGGRVGENIACSWSSAGADYTGDEVVEQWYSEIKQHNFRSDNMSMGSGHFTQLVWRGSRELGVGKAKGGNGKCVAVCSYRPAGNVVGTFRDNVLPPR